MSAPRNCNNCGKQKTCPKSRHIENYRIKNCPDHEWPEGTIICSKCGNPMEFAHEYQQETAYNQLVTGKIYYCEFCGNAEVIEKTWGHLDTQRKYYSYG